MTSRGAMVSRRGRGAGTSAGVVVVATRHHTVDHRGEVALDGLDQSGASGGEIVERLRWRHAQSVEIDDVDVGPKARCERAAIGHAVQCRIPGGLLRDEELERDALAALAIAGPVRELRRRHRGIADQRHVGTGIAQPGDGGRVHEHLADDVLDLVHVEPSHERSHHPAVLLEQEVVHHAEDVLTGRCRPGAEALGHLRLVVHGIGQRIDRRCGHLEQRVEIGHRPGLIDLHVVLGHDRRLDLRLRHLANPLGQRQATTDACRSDAARRRGTPTAP